MYVLHALGQNLPLFLTGLKNTLILLISSTSIACLLSIPGALALTRKVPIVAPALEVVSYVLRGTPLIVQVYLLYYGLAQFAAIRTSPLWPWLREAWVCILIAFSFGTAAYMTQILRGAIEAVPHGEIEAAKAAGLTSFQSIRLVVLPNAFRRALPAYENETVFSLHATAIASLITIVDLLGAGRNFNNIYYFTFEGYVFVSVVYLLIVATIRLIFGMLEHRLMRHLRRAAL